MPDSLLRSFLQSTNVFRYPPMAAVGTSNAVLALYMLGSETMTTLPMRRPTVSKSNGVVLECPNDIAVVRMLLRLGAAVICHDTINRILWRAVKYREFDLAKVLIEHGGANVSDPSQKVPLLSYVFGRHYPYHKRARQNDVLDMAAMIVAWGADVNSRGPHGQTALYHAVSTLRLSGVAFLLDAGANVNDTYRGGDTPLTLALRIEAENDAKGGGASRRTPLLQLLLERGADFQAVRDVDGAADQHREAK